MVKTFFGLQYYNGDLDTIVRANSKYRLGLRVQEAFEVWKTKQKVGSNTSFKWFMRDKKVVKVTIEEV